MVRYISLILFCLVNLIDAKEETVQQNISSQELYVIADNAQLFCRTFGQGKPLIVIHGGPGLTQDYLLPYMEKLGNDNFVIFYDQRACGNSTGAITPETVNLPQYLNDIETIRKHFGFEKVSVLGHSWGGFLGMHYAIHYPQSVDKLILLNSVPVSSEEFFLFLAEWKRRTSAIKEIEEIKTQPEFLAGDPGLTEKYYRLIFTTYCYKPESANDLNLLMTTEAIRNGTKAYALLNENTLQKPFNLHDELKKLNLPTLVIHGDSDIIPSSTAENIHKSIKGSQFILIKQCGHFPYIEKPEVLFESINAFLSKDS